MWRFAEYFCVVLAAFCFAGFGASAAVQDIGTAADTTVDQRLDTYLEAIRTFTASQKQEECDFLLSTCSSDSLRNHVAVRLYGHFIESSIMGDEAVAIHLFDNYFATGKASFYNDTDLMNARIYAEFNRSSQIGCRARSLLLESPEGEKVEALGLADSLFCSPSQRYRVLYFYEPDCNKCLMETIMLDSILLEEDYKIDFIAVNTGSDREKWDNYRRNRFDFESRDTKIYHYWDSSLDSDFQMKYGVIQTPRMFLIDKGGVIIGRGLDSAALKKMLDSIFAQTDYSEFYDMIFASYGDSLSVDSIREVADRIELSSLSAPGGQELYKKMISDLMCYTAGKAGVYKAGTQYIVREKVLSRPEIWTTQEDSLNVVSMAAALDQMLSRSAEGTRLSPVRVHASVIRRKKNGSGFMSRYQRINLSRLRDTYIMIYSPGCANCQEERIAAYESIDGKTKLLMVNMDDLMEAYPSEARELLDCFDLSILPYISYVSGSRIIESRFLSFR